ALADTLDWERLVDRVGDHWRVLLSHLILFGFIYPGEASKIPQDLMRALLRQLESDLQRPDAPSNLCQGTLVSREQYLIDIEEWGYRDARLEPIGNMTRRETKIWTRAIDEEE
ncbi:MAG TPA: hypothetical protein VGD69_28935, partial [Herpetosiphonaceae bacterium]